MPEQRIKKYVDVVAEFSADGNIKPLTVIWDDGQQFDITNIKCGGVGVRYTCQIGRSQTYLYYEVGKWFVEAKESIPEEPA